MSPAFNEAVNRIPPSGIRRIFGLATELKQQGRRVYPFHLGMPDFDTPEPIKASAIQRLQEGFVHYAPNAGIAELREAIADSVNRHRGTTITPAQVIVTVGACEALSVAIMATLQPGDELLVPTPCWPNYLQFPTLLGVQAVQVPASAVGGFVPDPDQIAAHISPKTRAILINTPNNPTGAIIPKDVLDALVQLAIRHQLWLITDEIYEDIVYRGYQHTSTLNLSAASEIAISVSGLSKTYSMTGWRLGYLIVPPAASAAMLKVHQYLVSSACSFAQWGGVTALREEPGKADMLLAYQERRDLVVAGLREAGLNFSEPNGAFYAFPEIPNHYADDEEFCRQMLLDHGLALVPGTVFGTNFQRYFRLCFACATGEVVAGMQALAYAMRTQAT